MTIDNEGNVYLTGKGVTVFDRTGKQIDHIDVPGEKWTANVSFGGKDRQTLFITASTGPLLGADAGEGGFHREVGGLAAPVE